MGRGIKNQEPLPFLLTEGMIKVTLNEILKWKFQELIN